MIRFTSRAASALAALLLAVAALAQPRAEEAVLNVYNWSDYIGLETLRRFEQETGIKVRYDNFDNNEIVHAKLMAGRSGYDVVIPSAHWARLQFEAGLLRKLDKQRLPNLVNLDPAIQERLAALDPGHQYMVNWLWGFTTVGINVEKVRNALGVTPMPDNAWDLVFKPEIVAKLRDCGVSFLDSASEVVPAALHYLGKPAYSKNPEDYAAAAALLKSVRPFVTRFSSSAYINELAAGSLCVALGWSGDINIARQRALDGKTGQKIEALLPKGGALLFFDVMVIPADAPHPGNAHRFIDFILRPENHASLSNQVFYANPNREARRFLKPEVAADPTVFPPPQDLARMVSPQRLDAEQRRLITRTYTLFKIGP